MIFNSAGNKNATIGCYIKFYNPAGGAYDICNDLLDVDESGATYNMDTGTLTIPIKKGFMAQQSGDSYVMLRNHLISIDVTGTSASGLASLNSTEIVINNFDGDNEIYSVHLTIARFKTSGGDLFNNLELDAEMTFTFMDLDTCGDALPSDVTKGVTFTSAAGLSIVGTRTEQGSVSRVFYNVTSKLTFSANSCDTSYTVMSGDALDVSVGDVFREDNTGLIISVSNFTDITSEITIMVMNPRSTSRTVDGGVFYLTKI